MTTLSIKDVPEDWAEVLRQRAARNHRSLQGELTAIIEAAVLGASEKADPFAAAARSGGRAALSLSGLEMPGAHRGSKTIEQIAREHRERFPQPVRGGPLAVDIIRKERDSR